MDNCFFPYRRSSELWSITATAVNSNIILVHEILHQVSEPPKFIIVNIIIVPSNLRRASPSIISAFSIFHLCFIYFSFHVIFVGVVCEFITSRDPSLPSLPQVFLICIFSLYPFVICVSTLQRPFFICILLINLLVGWALIVIRFACLNKFNCVFF
jgi:hypothetical protein